ncbi:sugar transferase [Sinisalibacter lacisalsi]|uniref:Glycosyl transferase n=1 Tax=Sinisalibacter lacisalsi TaxID=1526570 RepID=A0ABQ1QLH5_9RHOB|nr:sugar transferase [Sinisalibacter lacisalsi]GGD30074.1 glycosyl transferase [Sinisalibacter lacisalsi]
MAKRLFDILFALFALVITAPFLAFGVIGISLSSPGPVFYRARRIGRNGEIFDMLKLRSMHVASESGSSITAPGDARIFAFGNLLRRTKIDEIPQFWNILVGDMSVVGPRGEAPGVVEEHYTDWMMETLRVAPGATSPGAIYNYVMSDTLLDPEDPEGSYVNRMLTPKLALERAYVERAGLWRDMIYIVLTVAAILATVVGRKVGLPAGDVELARRWAPEGPFPE